MLFRLITTPWRLPGGLVVKTSPSNTGDVGSIPGWGAKIPHISQPRSQNIKQKQHCTKNSIRDFKNGPHLKKIKNKKNFLSVHNSRTENYGNFSQKGKLRGKLILIGEGKSSSWNSESTKCVQGLSQWGLRAGNMYKRALSSPNLLVILYRLICHFKGLTGNEMSSCQPLWSLPAESSPAQLWAPTPVCGLERRLANDSP